MWSDYMGTEVQQEMLGICRKLKEKIVGIYSRIFSVRFRVVVLGSEGSGKSAVVLRTFGNELRYVGTQRDAQVYECSEKEVIYEVYDVSGKRTSKAKWDYFYRRCDVLVYCVDSCWAPEEWERAQEELRSMLYRNIWTKRSMLVLGTKNDRKGAVGCKDIILNLDLLGVTDREVSCFSVSAEEDVNIGCIKSWLGDQCGMLRDRGLLVAGRR